MGRRRSLELMSWRCGPLLPPMVSQSPVSSAESQGRWVVLPATCLGAFSQASCRLVVWTGFHVLLDNKYEYGHWYLSIRVRCTYEVIPTTYNMSVLPMPLLFSFPSHFSV